MLPCILVLFTVFSQNLSLETTTRKIVDEDSQESLWNNIGHRFVQWNLTLKNGEVNRPPVRGKYLKVVCISDTHSNLDKIFDKIPDGDVLIHAGDSTDFGEKKELEEFNRLMGKLPHRHKIVIAGNHELGFDPREDESLRKEKHQGKGTKEGYKLYTNVTYIQDQSITIDGIVFYGTPWHPLKGFPFYRPRNVIGREWEKMPKKIDVLITHTPPLGYMDLYPPVERWGDFKLLLKVGDIRPSFHIFGHNHYNYGAMSNGPTTFVNAASKNGYDGSYMPPIVFYIPKRV